jgi:tetratricopeptide (TPR) repeat protein
MDVKNLVKAFRKVLEIGNAGNYYVLESTGFLRGFEQMVSKHHGTTMEAFFEGIDEFEKGLARMEEQAWEDSISHFEKSASINANHPQSYGNMGICYARLGRKAQALEAFDNALRLDRNYEPALFNKALVESVEEGEPLPEGKVTSVDYAKDFRMENKSYLQSVLDELKGPK